MADLRVERLAKILVDHSAQIKPGDRVAIEATTAAEPLVRALYAAILERGGHPYLLLELTDQDEILFAVAKNEQLDATPPFRKLAYDQFESRIRIHSATNPRALSGVDPAKQRRRQKSLAPIMEAQMRRGADRSFKWVTTLFPTKGFAAEAGMSLRNFEDFVYHACHADEADPVAFWKKVETKQCKIIDRIQGHNQVILRGPNVDLTLSIKGRKFLNGAGLNNMPDGEIYTGPVEDSVNGWVRFSYPAIYNGVMVEGVELTFTNGRVEKAKADKNQPFLLEMCESDPGARTLGEFAIGTNYEIDHFSRNILFDEKLGGTFHMALGAGYPETGSKNKSMIHWDMICGMQDDSEIVVDGEVIYKNGKFTF
ncbi:MAG: aminopeptidase [Candidatus Atribacteria bacterium]|nr:aminopeptidase [Candidatus Atribacteria bacterium]